MKERIRTTGNDNKQTKYEITLYNENVQNIFIYYINVLYIKASPPKCETTVVDDQHRIVQTEIQNHVHVHQFLVEEET